MTILSHLCEYLNRQKRLIRTHYELKLSPRPVTKVYGLLRTGTNYISKLIELNFYTYCLQSEEQGWKHGPCQYTEKLRYVFVVKNPYSWLKSFREWEIIHNRVPEDISISEFIVGDLSHHQLNRAWAAQTPLEAWNEALKSWSQYFNKPNVTLIKYEDLLDNFNACMAKIRDNLNLTMNHSEFHNIKERVDNWKTPKPRHKLNKGLYQGSSILDSYSKNEKALFREKLDPKVVDYFSYNIS